MSTANELLPGPRILGIDPGLHITGYAMLESNFPNVNILEAGVLRADGEELAARLLILHRGLKEILEQFSPTVMVVEQLYSHYAHPRTAILMGHARGAVLLAAAERNIPTINYSATRIKKTIAGSGRAPKDQIQRTIQRELGLPTLPEPPDVADALAVALCHHHLQNVPVASKRR
jgi:crossover junction endodeoxyribonuclease RuvC